MWMCANEKISHSRIFYPGGQNFKPPILFISPSEYIYRCCKMHQQVCFFLEWLDTSYSWETLWTGLWIFCFFDKRPQTVLRGGSNFQVLFQRRKGLFICLRPFFVILIFFNQYLCLTQNWSLFGKGASWEPVCPPFF